MIDGIEYSLPTAAALVRSLKRRLGLWVHVNVYHTPAGSAHGFGLHSDRTDVIILQLEGEKHWDVCGRVLPDLANVADFGEVPDVGTPHRHTDHTSSYNAAAAQVLASQPVVVQRAVQPTQCKRVRLRRGDVLYLPSGQIHMAESSQETASLHATIGVARTHHGHTWAGLLTHMATNGEALDGPPSWLASILRRTPRLHQLPRAVTQANGNMRSLSRSWGTNSLVCAVHTGDFADNLLLQLREEFTETIAPALLKKKSRNAQEFVHHVEDDPDRLFHAILASRDLMQRAMRPLGLQFDASSFPDPSPSTLAWDALCRNATHRQPLTLTALEQEYFVRTPDKVVWLTQEPRGDTQALVWLIVMDTLAPKPFLNAHGDVEGDERGQTGDGEVIVPAHLVDIIGWVLGCYSGAAFQSFRQRDMVDMGASTHDSTETLQFLWLLGLIDTTVVQE